MQIITRRRAYLKVKGEEGRKKKKREAPLMIISIFICPSHHFLESLPCDMNQVKGELTRFYPINIHKMGICAVELLQ